ncbi:MAG: aspartate aminotransferase family protein [Verrucomicrobia bacterium]|nr:aspartate aminotransferase family protein [Verrucomicrobiota bacterium]
MLTPENPSLAPLQSEGDLNVSPHRAGWAETHLDDATRRALEEDSRWFIHQSLSTPCLNVLHGCQGASLEDAQGRQLLDFHGNNVHQVGFGHSRVIEAITRQLRELSFCPRRYTNLPAIQLAKRLAQLAPGNLNRVLFAPGGTTAIGMALKLARVVTGRFKTISWWDSFHGASLDAVSVGGESIFRSHIGPLLPGAEHVPPPEPRRCPFRCGSTCNLACADYLEYVLDKEQDVAAVIAEPVRCTPAIPPRDYWKQIRAACDRHGTLLIFDEIPLGLGRTGRTFACEHYEVVPDMLVIGKGLGGGILPLAALIARDDFATAAAERALGHYTHEKNPVLCAAGLATLDILESENLPARAQSLGAIALRRLAELADRHPCIGDIRGLGLLLGLEIVRDRQSMKPDSDLAERIMYDALRRGLNFKVTMGNRITLTPALTITEAELLRGLDLLDQSLSATAPEPA